MNIVWAFILAFFGASLGSFLNVCIDRVPAGKSLAYPPSRCDSCQRRLSVLDLVPVVSYLWLRGRCRYCGAAIPRRVLVIEAATGLLVPLLYLYYGLTVQFALLAYYGCLFLVIAVIDLEHRIVPNRIVYPAAVLALVLTFVPGQPGIIASLLGGAVGLGLMLLPVLISRGGMGLGDVKLAALSGLIIGPKMVLLAIFIAVVAGGLIAVFLVVTRLKSRKEAIPFAPFLALGAVLALYRGADLLDVYVRYLLP
ncbi:MAG: prepilin peptidase [Chloroflexi bacterium]|nr:prepilin peptidase [Chloroflexota bacterium]